MADAVGTVAVAEELAISPPANLTSPTLAVTGKSLVVGRLRSNPYRSTSALL